MNMSEACRADGRVSFVTREEEYVEDLGDGRRLYEPTILEATRMAHKILEAAGVGVDNHEEMEAVLATVQALVEDYHRSNT